MAFHHAHVDVVSGTSVSWQWIWLCARRAGSARARRARRAIGRECYASRGPAKKPHILLRLDGAAGFLEARFDAWITGVSAVNRMLTAAATSVRGRRQPPPPEFVHFLLDRGADPNLVQWVERREASMVFMSPLAAVIFGRFRSMCQLLLDRGADRRGPPMQKGSIHWAGLALIPIFAAVQVMAEQDDMTMLEWCLDCGADINQCAVVVYDGGYCDVTPVLIYLHYVD